MTKLQKAQKRLSESRTAINELTAKAERTPEDEAQLSELRSKHADLEAEYRQALEDTPPLESRVVDGERREFQGLLDRASIGNILAASLSQRATDGAEAELQQHFGLAPNQIALEQLEVRAVTPAPSEVGQTQQPIIGEVFPEGLAAFLGVSMPTVGVGESTYTVLTTGATVGTPAKNAAQAETTGAFTASVLSPKRAQASFFWAIEDEARLAGMEQALRQNLRAALSSKFDELLLTDSAGGLLGGGLTAPNDPGSEVEFAGYKTALTGRVDGRYASTPDQVRLLLGSETYRHAEGKYRSLASAGGPNESAYELLIRKSGGVRVSSHVPAAASNIQGAVAARRLGSTHAVMPIWRGITLISDRVTKASAGQVQLTAVALWSLKVLRAAGFARLKFKLA